MCRVHACMPADRGDRLKCVFADSRPRGLSKPSQTLSRDPATWDTGSADSVFWTAGTGGHEATRVAYAALDPALFQPLGVTRMTVPTEATIGPCNDGHYMPLACG